MIEHFVQTFSDIYGSHHVVYNVHSLTHIVEDVKLYGCLDNYSAFPFESHMYQIKRKLNKNNHKLAQICNRIEEMYNCRDSEKMPKKGLQFKQRDKNNINIFREIVFENFKLSCKSRDQWFMTSDNNVYKFIGCEHTTDKYFVNACKVTKLDEFYTLPVSSSKFNIFSSDGQVSQPLRIDIDIIKSKVFVMRLDDKFIYAPLRHSC